MTDSVLGIGSKVTHSHFEGEGKITQINEIVSEVTSDSGTHYVRTSELKQVEVSEEEEE